MGDLKAIEIVLIIVLVIIFLIGSLELYGIRQTNENQQTQESCK